MAMFVFRRLYSGALVLIAVVTVVFVITRIIGDPVAAVLPLETTAAQRAAFAHQYGLDQPIWVQFGAFLGKLAHFDLGESMWQKTPVTAMVFSRMPLTLILVSTSMVLALLLAIPLGIVAALNPGGLADRTAVGLSLLGLSVPQFWLGLMLIILFSVRLHLLPTSGTGDLKHLVLPAVTLALPALARMVMVIRSSLIDEMNAQYIRVQFAKGMPLSRIMLVHALPNIAAPIMTLAGWEFDPRGRRNLRHRRDPVRLARHRADGDAGDHQQGPHPAAGHRLLRRAYGGDLQFPAGHRPEGGGPARRTQLKPLSTNADQSRISTSRVQQSSRFAAVGKVLGSVRSGFASDIGGLFGAAVIALLVFAALFAPLIAPHDPTVQSIRERLLPPAFVAGGEFSHFFGTDNLGRDILSRLIFGGRISLFIGVAVVSIAGGAGIILGIFAGYKGGKVDAAIMRVADTQIAFPGLLLALTILAVIGSSISGLVIVLCLNEWMLFARIARSATLSLRQAEFVAAAEMAGARPWRIVRLHLLPNLLSPLITLAILEFANVLLAEAGLSFLGVGVQPPASSWGLDVATGKAYIFNAWWLVTFPGLAIAITVFAANLLANWLRIVTSPIESREAVRDPPAGGKPRGARHPSDVRSQGRAAFR